MNSKLGFLTFHVGSLYCGVPVRNVLEVVCGVALTPVPTAGPVVAGLMNLRGRIIVVIDLLRRLDLAVAAGAHVPDTHIVTCVNRPVSLLVDRAGDVVDIPEDRIRRSMPTLPATIAHAVVGV